MPANLPPLVTLVGRTITLEPMTRDHLPDLFCAIGHPQVFAAGYGGGPAAFRDTEAGFVEWGTSYYDWDAGRPFLIRSDGRVVGTTTLTDFDLPNEATHIGWTAYDPRVWGTVVNPEAKLLLLGHAFEHGFGRVKIQADAVNDRSRAAIAKLGATFEGIVRRDRPRADGTWRDSAVFSIIVDDWPRVRSALQARVDALIESTEPR